MENSSVSNFKDIFGKHKRNTVSLYSKNDSPIHTTSFPMTNRMRSTQDVMLSINENIRLLQKADRVVKSDLKRKRKMDKSQRGIVPFSTLVSSPTDENHYPIPKFETQLGVTDTQLVALTDGAEAMVHIMQNKHGTQCFDTTNTTLHQSTNGEDNSKPSTSYNRQIEGQWKEINKNIPVNNQDIKDDKRKTNKFDQVINIGPDSMFENGDILKITQETGFESDRKSNNKRSTSPILKVSNLNYKKLKRKGSNLSPKFTKVFSLEEFENFEQNLQDSEVNVVNSQILGEELHFAVGQTTDTKFFQMPSKFTRKDSCEYYEPDNSPKRQSHISQVMPIISDVLILSESCQNFENEDSNAANGVSLNIDSNDGKQFSTTQKALNLEKNKEQYIGFCTASNKSIKVSLESLNKSISSFEEMGKIDLENLQSEFQCNLESNNKLEDFENNSEINRKKHSKLEDKSQKSTITSNDLQTYATKVISANLSSEDRLALKVLDDIETNDFSNSPKLVFEEKNVGCSVQFRNVIAAKTNKFPSFSTADNKKIHVSEKILKSYQNVPCQDFTTASDTILEVSEKTNVNSDKIFPSVSSNNKSSTPTTASNQIIPISKKVFQKTNNLFNDLNQVKTNEITNQELPFATTSYESKKILGQTLENTDDLCNDAFDRIINENNDITDLKVPFKGFATASNKPVLVSENALLKTKNIFDDLDTVEMNFNANKGQAPFQGFSTASNKTIPVSEKALQNTKKLFNDIDQVVTKEIVNKELLIKNFAAANNEFKQVSGQMLEHNNDICNEAFDNVINENNIIDLKVPFKGFATASNKPVLVSEKALLKTKNIFDDLDTVEMNFNAKGQMPVQGFSAASNKTIPVSEKALQNTKNVLNDMDQVVTNPIANKEWLLNNFATANNESKQVSGQIELNDDICNEAFDHQAINENNDITDVKVSIKGFSTASNKPVLVSEAALLKTKNLFNDLDQVAANETANPELFLNNFVTANNKNKRISGQTLENTEDICNEAFDKVINENNDITDLKVPFKGFATASNKPVLVSEAALLKTKNLFNDLDQVAVNETANPELFLNNFVTANNKNKQISGQTLENTDDICNEAFDKVINDNNDITDLKVLINCFATANSKPVKVSEKVLLKTKHMFDDLNNVENNVKDKIKAPLQGFSTTSHKIIPVTEKTLDNTINLFNDLEQDTTNVIADQKIPLKGFATGSNKPILVSKRAILKIKNIFDDIDKVESNLDQKGIKILEKKEMQGFPIASNRTIYVSEQALQKTKNIFNDLDQENSNEVGNQEMSSKGFSTASNKPVPVSEEAMFKTKHIFDDLEKVDPYINVKGRAPFQGFSTASNKTIVVSEEAVAKTKNIFNDSDPGEMNKAANREMSFKDFATASNKRMKMSEEALEKTKNIFNDLDRGKINEIANRNKSLKDCTIVSNKAVNVSESAFLESETIFNDFDEQELKEIAKMDVPFAATNNETATVSRQVISEKDRLCPNMRNENENFHFKLKNHKCNEPKTYLNEELDTQLIGHFENINFTGDTQKNFDIPTIEENRNKTMLEKPSSPIFSCPSARKRKWKKSFQVPYSKFRKILSKAPTDAPINVDDEKRFENKIEREMKIAIREYGRHEGNGKLRICLKELKCLDGNENCNSINKNELLSFESLNEFTFKNERIDVAECCGNKMSVPDLETIFLSSVDRNLVPDGWFLNHFKLIAWKLISYESFFPNTMNNVFSVKNILEQLQYRFRKELYRVERPCLRKVLEMDEVPSRNMVLVVVRIHNVKNENGSDGIELDLTDGWYIVRSSLLDKLLSTAVQVGKIRVGTKLLVYGAELLNCDQGKSPLEDISNVRLRISGNSTRRVTWDTKLGFFRRQDPVLVPLNSVSAGGGKVPRLRVFIARIYPRMYVEKLPNGNTVTRSERLETVFASKYESYQQSRLEKVYEEVEKELELTLSSQSETVSSLSETGTKLPLGMDTGSQIHKMMRLSTDIEGFQKVLTNSQIELVRVYNDRKREKLHEEIEKRIRCKLEDQGFSQVLRKVITLLKMRVVTWDHKSGLEPEMRTAFMSIWRPDEGLNDVLKEGVWIDVVNAIPTGERLAEVQLSANRQTIFMESKILNKSRNDEFEKAVLRKHTPLAELSKTTNQRMLFNEIDTCGLVFHIEPSLMTAKDSFQMVFLTDGEFNMVSIIFWSGIQKFGFENIVEIGQFVCSNNLQKRMGNNRKGIPQFRVTEFSTFTRTPKVEHQIDGLQNLKSSFNEINLQNLKNFCKNCLEAKINLEASMELVNSKSKAHFNSINNTAINNNNKYNYDVYSSDFESTFVSENDKSYSKNKCKLEILKTYGEPPPLSAIKLLNKSDNVLKEFESPIRNDTSKKNVNRCQSVNIASDENKKCDVENVAIMNKENNFAVGKCDVNNVNMSLSNNNEDLETSIPNVAVTKNFKDLGVASSEKLVIKERDHCSNFVETSLEVRKLFLNPIRINFDQQEDERVNDEDAKLSFRSGFEEELEFSPPMSLE